ncbi:MAG: hypothetical protein RR992_09055, partial [Clostridiales bacterium]
KTPEDENKTPEPYYNPSNELIKQLFADKGDKDKKKTGVTELKDWRGKTQIASVKSRYLKTKYLIYLILQNAVFFNLAKLMGGESFAL